jgi:predicted nucleotidyltransferase
MHFETITKDLLDKARDVLDGDLVSIVLFGSRARGTATSSSDFDFLIVAHSLPDGKRRRELALDIAEVGFDYGLPIQIILATSEEAEQAATTGAPLMFEIHDAHRLVYDRGGFFDRLVGRFAEQLRTWQARKIKDRVWEVPGLATARP